VHDLGPVLNRVNQERCRPILPAADVQEIARDAAHWTHPPLWVVDPLAFISDSRLPFKERLILRLLCDHADADGHCSPGLVRLAKVSGINRPNTVLDLLESLASHGRIEFTRRSRTRGNAYRLLAWSPRDGGGTSETSPPPPLRGGVVL
jgi:hypothetical protein